MAIGIGNLGNIVEDFTNSLNEIFGLNNNSGGTEKGGSGLFESRVGGSQEMLQSNWIGNAGSNKNLVRYGFLVLTLEQVVGRKNINNNSQSVSDSGGQDFFLQIPPQSLQQKEIFANQIQATRRGVIVETEGVVFRDIVLQGTTGIFPGQRGSANNERPNFSDFTKPPEPATGVSKDKGRSTASGVSTISGYEEFIRLRQFFLKYARDKVDADGNLFLIFINEKDRQQLIVEPLEFNMIRNAQNPMTYEYRIVLKGIGDLNGLFQQVSAEGDGADGFLGFLEDAGNIAANVSATIATGRAVINQSTRLLSRISQGIDQTINGPLRQLQFATEDINDGLTTVFSLPEILVRNTTNTILNIRENIADISSTVNTAFGSSFAAAGQSAGVATAGPRVLSESQAADAAATFSQQQDVLRRIQNDTREPIPRSFVESTKNEVDEIANKVTDFVGLGSAEFDAIKGRSNTAQPDPLKTINDQEIQLLGALVDSTQALNVSLASNALFESQAEVAFEEAASLFENESLPEDQQINIPLPTATRQVTIEYNDTLERIAQREYGNALRWLDLVVLNDLKPPYISENGEDGTLAPGEQILIGNK